MSKNNPLNESFFINCEPNYNKYEKIFNEVFLIDNFFKNFDAAQSFFNGLDKWDCSSYSMYPKPAYEIKLPSWIGLLLLKKYIIENNINDNLMSYMTDCNSYFYDEDTSFWSVTNYHSFPHVDSYGPKDGCIHNVCLINLNDQPVKTRFYRFDGEFECSNVNSKKWDLYYKTLDEKLLKRFYNQKITYDKIENFLLENQNNLKIKLLNEVEYQPNQAIVYPANYFHSVGLTKDFNRKNSRLSLRILFEKSLST